MATTKKRKRPTPPTAFASLGWLQTRPLNMNSAIEYFSMSEYYNSNSLQHKIFTGELTKEQIKPLKGIVYRVEEPTNQPPSQPPLTFPMFIIHEELQIPHHPNQAIAVYYISDGTIYKSPSIYHILQTRVHKAITKLEQAISFLSERTVFDQTRGWHWEEEASSAPGSGASESAKKKTKSTTKKKEVGGDGVQLSQAKKKRH